MLVIKMLKKISNMNNEELGILLNKNRNTIASWEKDEDSIPTTEKEKIAKRFNFMMVYWYVGLDRSDEFYQKMYNDIRKGYLFDSAKSDKPDKNEEERILRICEQMPSNKNDNELEHYAYLNSLLNSIDPINGEELSENHFINDYRIKGCFDFLNQIINDKLGVKESSSDEKETISYVIALKKWRTYKAVESNVKSFQILSDSLIDDLAKIYVIDGCLTKRTIKGFPKGGKKWNLYFDEIDEVLKEVK